VSAPGCPFPPRSFALNRFPPQQPQVTPAVTENSHSSFSCLILFAFPQGYRKVALQQPFWGDVSSPPDAEGSVLFGLLRVTAVYRRKRSKAAPEGGLQGHSNSK
jgi:hypothetical protein